MLYLSLYTTISMVKTNHDERMRMNKRTIRMGSKKTVKM